MPVQQASGRIAAQAVYARSNVPHYLASAMDGIAIKASLTFAATDLAPVILEADQYWPVDTGDPLPEDCDAVVMIEDVIRPADPAAPAGRVLLHAPAAPWQHVRQIGEDFCAGDMLVKSRDCLTPAGLAALVAGGVLTVEVLSRPRIVLIPTGDEIVSPGLDLKPGQIPEFNSTLFGSLLTRWGAEVRTTPIVPDQLEALEEAVRKAAGEADLVCLLAGSSAGRDDLAATVIERVGELLVHGLAIRPGKPAIVGLSGSVPVFGLPGYAISGLVVLEALVAPWLAERFALPIPEAETVRARLSRRLVSSLKYQEYVRVRLSRLADGYAAIPLERGAGLVTSYLKADGMLVVPQNTEGYEAGDEVTVRLLRPRLAIDRTLSVIGSHDPLLDECADLFARSWTDGISLASSHTGSFGGILAIRRHEAHLAGIHLLDPASGRYNVDQVRQSFPERNVILVEGVRRQQGLLVAAGNPLAITGLEAVTRMGLRYVNRQKGAGTRILLDHLLDRLELTSSRLNGYTREEFTHTAVAAQIASGSADAGLGILAAARLFDLDFLPIAMEHYDFLIAADAFDTPPVQRFLTVIRSQAFADRLAQLGGYELDQIGRVIPVFPTESETILNA
jgi:putative molybdopterin biosynthesis protein